MDTFTAYKRAPDPPIKWAPDTPIMGTCPPYHAESRSTGSRMRRNTVLVGMVRRCRQSGAYTCPHFSST